MKFRLLGIVVMAVFASAGLFLSLWAVSKLEQNSIKSSKSLSILISSLLVSSLSDEDIYKKLQKVISEIDFPVAILDNRGNVKAFKNLKEEEIANLRFSEDIIYYDKRVGTLKYDYPRYIGILRFITFFIYGGIIVISVWMFFSLYFSIRYEQVEFWMGFAKGLAHQLATPVSSLYGWYEMIKMNIPDEARLGMKKDIERLSSVLRRFSKLGGTLILTEIDVSDVIKDVVKDMSEKYRKSAIITFESQRDVKIKGDGELIGWAVENMIKNSVEAGADKVRVEVKVGGGKVCISVIDNGKGFTRKEIKMAFKKTFSTKQRGWGVGLTLIRKIAEIHNGEVFVEKSEPFFETVITMCIPLVKYYG